MKCLSCTIGSIPDFVRSAFLVVALSRKMPEPTQSDVLRSNSQQPQIRRILVNSEVVRELTKPSKGPNKKPVAVAPRPRALALLDTLMDTCKGFGFQDTSTQAYAFRIIGDGYKEFVTEGVVSRDTALALGKLGEILGVTNEEIDAARMQPCNHSPCRRLACRSENLLTPCRS